MWQVYARHLGADWNERASEPGIWDAIENVDGGERWEAHQTLKARLITFTRRRVVRQAERRGEPASGIAALRSAPGPDARALYCSALERSGHTVVTVEDGFAALQYLESARPKVIVLDMIVPRLSGRDVLRQLRANPETRQIPVVIITGSDVSNLSERAGIPVLQKPFALSLLVDAVDSAVRRASV